MSDINTYIQQSRQQGMSDEQIKKNLLASGWTEEAIGAIFNRSQITPTESKNVRTSVYTIIRRIVSGVFWVLQALLIWVGLSIYFKNQDDGIILFFIIPILLTITGLQVVLTKGIAKKINTGILLLFAIYIVYLILEF